jgi:acyl carrier protein
MNLQKFIGEFAEQFDDTGADEFRADTKFKEMMEWSSMIALSIIAMVDEEYGVTIKGDDIRKSETIENLFDIIKAYKQ